MGEMADYYLEQEIDHGDSLFYDLGDNDIQASSKDGISHVKGKPITCKYCGQTTLRWNTTPEGKWRLYTVKGELHSCTGIGTGKEITTYSVGDIIEVNKCGWRIAEIKIVQLTETELVIDYYNTKGAKILSCPVVVDYTRFPKS